MVIEKKVSVWLRANIKQEDELAILRDLYNRCHVDEIEHKYKLEFTMMDDTIDDIDNHNETSPTIEMTDTCTGDCFYTDCDVAYRPDYVLKNNKESDIEIQSIINLGGRCSADCTIKCPCEKALNSDDPCTLIFCDRYEQD